MLTVVDGDTFVARQGAHLFLIKLNDVEAPELTQSYGNVARDALAAQIAEQTIVIWPEVAEGWVISARVEMTDSTDVAEKMLRLGMVWASPSAPDYWRRLEIYAKGQGLGLWRDSNPEPPWEFRKANQ